MAPSIFLLGPVPAEVRLQIEPVARQYGFDLVGCPDISRMQTGVDPAGFISFLACTRESVRDFWAQVSVGFIQELPFFQYVGTATVPVELHDLSVTGCFCLPLKETMLHTMMLTIDRAYQVRGQTKDLTAEVSRYRRQKNQLISIGMALSSQNNADALLDQILFESRSAVGADAGSIYVREYDSATGMALNRLWFRVAQNDSVDMAQKSKVFPIEISNATISGHVARTGVPLNLSDVYELGPEVPFKWGSDFDKRFNYRMKSMLTIPLKNMGGEVVGVLQLMNKKTSPDLTITPHNVAEAVVPFNRSDEELLASIASLAAVSIERVLLYQNIQDLFEGFLSASTAAIDQRDRVTAGHSRRVMGYAMAFVDAVNGHSGNGAPWPAFSETRKRQFKFAALLHDFGKVGVPEALLTKESRLPESAMKAIAARAEMVKMAQHIPEFARTVPWKDPAEIDADMAFLQKVNRSGFLDDESAARLAQLQERVYPAADGSLHPFLEPQEIEQLSVRRGNLTPKEREQINSHALGTRRILARIPWSRDLCAIPDIACHHHEKIDGSGYPDGLRGEEISLESRILAVVDIFEALVAQDRPYKPRMPVRKALAILREEADRNHLDPEIVSFFIDQNIFRVFNADQE